MKYWKDVLFELLKQYKLNEGNTTPQARNTINTYSISIDKEYLANINFKYTISATSEKEAIEKAIEKVNKNKQLYRTLYLNESGKIKINT